MAVRMTDRRSITGEDNNLAEEAGVEPTKPVINKLHRV